MNYSSVFHLHPLVPFAVSLMSGIGFSHSVSPDGTILAVTLCLLVVLTVVCRRSSRLCTILLLLSTFWFGAWITHRQERSLDLSLPTDRIGFKAVVVDEPVDRGKTLRLDLFLYGGELSGQTVRAFLQKDASMASSRHVGVGDYMEVRSRLKKPTNFENSNFDYVTYLHGRGIVATTFIPHSDWSFAEPMTNRLPLSVRVKVFALRLRSHLLRKYSSLGVTGEEFAVVSAMTLGAKSFITDKLRDAYSATGTSHILALSGMHLGIIYSLLSFFAVGRRRVWRELLLMVAIWVYVFVVGLSPSVVRSALMLTVYSFLGIDGRHRMSLNALAFSAIVILLFNPLSLYDISFQLSFMSVAFILLYTRRLCSIVPLSFQQSHPMVKYVWQLLCVSMVAQLGTSPLVVYYFGSFPVYFLVANLIVIPIATLILYSSVVMLSLSFFPFLQSLLAGMLVCVVGFLNKSMSAIAHLPCAYIDDIGFNRLQVLLTYLVIFSLFHVLALCRNRMTGRETGF